MTRAFTLGCLADIFAPIPRIARVAPGKMVYHVLNRASGRLLLFKKEQAFLAFQEVLALAHQRLPIPIRILDWVIMSCPAGMAEEEKQK